MVEFCGCRLPCCALNFFFLFPFCSLIFFFSHLSCCSLNFFRTYPAVLLIFFALTLLCPSRFTITTPAVRLSALRFQLTLLCIPLYDYHLTTLLSPYFSSHLPCCALIPLYDYHLPCCALIF